MLMVGITLVLKELQLGWITTADGKMFMPIHHLLIMYEYGTK